MARQAADTAVAWWWWNWLSGGRVGCGPTMYDGADRWKNTGRRAALAVPRWVPLVVLAVWFVPASWPWLLLVAVVGQVLVAVAAVVVTWRVCRWWHRRRWVWPIAHAVAGYFKCDPTRRFTRNWIRVRRDLHRAPERNLWLYHRPAGIVIGLGSTFQAKPQETEQLQNLIQRKLDVPAEQLSFRWQMRSNWSYLQVRSKVLVPDSVLWNMEHVRGAVESTRKTVMLGLGPGERPVALDLDDESPHLMFSAGTGAGKSVGIRAVVSQLIHGGARCIVLDIKRHSHQWLNDVPGVHYVRDVGDVHDMLCRLQRIGDERNRLWDNVGLDEQGPTFPRLVVLLEEIGQTTRQLKRHWSQIRVFGDPPVSPAIDALAWLLMMGRAVQLHVVGAIQMGTAKDLGGTEIRENFGVRCLSHYSKGAWRMLAGDIDYVPAVMHRGRFQVIKGTQATETQLMFMSPHEARDYAREGARELAAGSVAALSHLGKQGATVAEATLLGPVPELGPSSQDPMPLRAIAPLLDTNEAALKRALQRARANGVSNVPAPVGRDGQVDVYDPEAVGWWHRNRPRVTAGTGG